jgi:hypothetical protein
MINIAVAAAMTMNLLCAGTLDSESIAGSTSKPFNTTFRIDLDKKIYCDDECKATHPLADVLPTTIVFDKKDVDGLTERSMTSLSVNRETGEYTGLYTYSDPRNRASVLIMKWKGQCTKQDFTGFPTFTTKF